VSPTQSVDLPVKQTNRYNQHTDSVRWNLFSTVAYDETMPNWNSAAV